MSIIEEILERQGGDKCAAAAELGTRLMHSDKATFKAGYKIGSAIAAAREAYALDPITFIGLLNERVLREHWASITPGIEERAKDEDPFAWDEDGDYIGMLRECACGAFIEGYYEYALHLKEALA